MSLSQASRSVRVAFMAAIALASTATPAGAQEEYPDLIAPILSFGEVVEVEVNSANGTYAKTGSSRRTPALVVDVPHGKGELVFLVIETDARIMVDRMHFKKGGNNLDTIPNWKPYGGGTCKHWKLPPGRYVCEISDSIYKMVDENGLTRLLIEPVGSDRARVKFAIFPGVIGDKLGFMNAQWSALLADGRKTHFKELVSQLDAPARLLTPAIVAKERANFVPRGVKAFTPEIVPSDAARTFASGKPAALAPFFAALYQGGENNAVLNFQKLGLAAIEAGEWAIAEQAFDSALERIEAIYADDPAAQGARSNWEDEAFKDFKGEPYERAMTYYYRGLLYLRSGDFENASAAFRAGEYQDTMADTEAARSDFSILPYLAGWAERCRGDDDRAAEFFAVAASGGIPAPGANEQMLLVAESGGAPIKRRLGLRQEFTTYVAPFSTDDELVPVVQTAGGPVPVVGSTSIFLQAATRGERGMDAILKRKVGHGDTIRKVVDAIPIVNLFVANDVHKKLNELGTRADVRAWDSLPHRVSAAAFAKQDITGSQITFAGAPVAARFSADHAGCSIVWSRQNSAIAEGAGVSGGDPEIDAARAGFPSLERRDAVFRQELFEQ